MTAETKLIFGWPAVIMERGRANYKESMSKMDIKDGRNLVKVEVGD